MIREWNMCVRPWQGLLVHFEEKLPGANVVGSQPIGQTALECDRAIEAGLRGPKDAARFPKCTKNVPKCTKSVPKMSQPVPTGTIGVLEPDRALDAQKPI